MDDWFLELRIVYEDLPDMIELETRVKYGDWAALSWAYVSPDFTHSAAQLLVDWARSPKDSFHLSGGSAGGGSIDLQFYTIDSAGHARCAISLVTRPESRNARPAEIWRFAIEMRTELGLIERFGQECKSLGRASDIARLSGLAT